MNIAFGFKSSANPSPSLFNPHPALAHDTARGCCWKSAEDDEFNNYHELMVIVIIFVKFNRQPPPSWPGILRQDSNSQ